MILLRPICWLLGHKRGRPFRPIGVYSTEHRSFRCPRCSRITFYKVKPKSADVLQIPVSRT